MKYLVVCFLVAAGTAALAAAPAKQAFTGTISDDLCSKASHAAMGMGSTDGECTIACVDEHGASYVFVDGKDIYILSDQRAPEKFAGQKVRVLGTLDTKTKKIQ